MSSSVSPLITALTSIRFPYRVLHPLQHLFNQAYTLHTTNELTLLMDGAQNILPTLRYPMQMPAEQSLTHGTNMECISAICL